MAGTIVWLEDDGFFVRKLIRPFEEDGYTVIIFETASSLLDRMDLISSCALLIIDLLVPGGPDHDFQDYSGLDVLKRVSSLPKVPPILVFSVVYNKSIITSVNSYTPYFLRKPIRSAEFVDTVRLILNSSKRQENGDPNG